MKPLIINQEIAREFLVKIFNFEIIEKNERVIIKENHKIIFISNSDRLMSFAKTQRDRIFDYNKKEMIEKINQIFTD